MKKEIIFRGKTKLNEWIYWNEYGGMVDENGNPKAYNIDMIRVIYIDTAKRFLLPETVGQFTGLTDKNGKKIFEGDIVTGLFLHSMPVNGIAAFRDGSFGLLWDRAGAETFNAFTSMCNVEYEVIGNIHDNKELIKAGDLK